MQASRERAILTRDLINGFIFIFTPAVVCITMSTKTVTLTMNNDYPFSVSSDYEQPRTSVQVRKTLSMGLEPRCVMKEKIRCLKSLGSNLIVALTATNEEENSLNLIFEYVHKKLEDEQWNMEPEIAERVQNELLQLADILAAHWIVHELRFQNVGLDKYFRLKYFLGFEFRIDKALNKDELSQKYKRQIESMFGKGGRFRRTSSPAPLSKQEYYSTMDTTNGKFNSLLEQKSDNEGTGGRLMMKKSATVVQNPKQNTFNDLQQWWQGNNDNPNKMMMSVGCNQHFNHETTNEIKTVKMEDIGARINKLKNYMKEVTGKTPKGSSTLGQIFVKVDENNEENKIFQENKMYITPNYTKLEKKIAQFRASRFYRGYGEKQIIFNKDNKGYIVRTTDKVENVSEQTKQPKALNFDKKPPLQITIPKNGDKKVPQYLLDREKMKKHQKSKVTKEEIDKSESKDQNPSYHTDYKKLGKSDKYCEEFMYFLEDDDLQGKNGGHEKEEMSPLTRLISQIGSEVNQEKTFAKEERQSAVETSETSKSAVQIHGRVQKAIRNSLKLISGLKYRQSQTVK